MQEFLFKKRASSTVSKSSCHIKKFFGFFLKKCNNSTGNNPVLELVGVKSDSFIS